MLSFLSDNMSKRAYMDNTEIINYEFEFYGQAFFNALNDVTSSRIGAEREELSRKIISVVYSVNPHWVLSPANLTETTKDIFSDEIFSSFILELTCNFYSRICMSKCKGAFVAALSESLCLTEGENNLMPVEIKKRLLSKDAVINVLTDNNWLVTYIFLIMFGGPLILGSDKVNGEAK